MPVMVQFHGLALVLVALLPHSQGSAGGPGSPQHLCTVVAETKGHQLTPVSLLLYQELL